MAQPHTSGSPTMHPADSDQPDGRSVVQAHHRGQPPAHRGQRTTSSSRSSRSMGGSRSSLKPRVGGSWREAVSGQYPLNQWYHVAGTYDGRDHAPVRERRTRRWANEGGHRQYRHALRNRSFSAPWTSRATISRARSMKCASPTVVRYTGNFTITPYAHSRPTRTPRNSGILTRAAARRSRTPRATTTTARWSTARIWTTDTPINAGPTSAACHFGGGRFKN